MTANLSRRIAAEFVGTGFLVAAVVGSEIMGERLAGGNVALALLANTIATGAALAAREWSARGYVNETDPATDLVNAINSTASGEEFFLE